VSRTGRENLLRAWQNGRLWWNDPDTLVQTGLPENEARFHATLVYATGGAVLAGDDLATLPADKMPVVQSLSRPTGVAAEFEDLSLTVGRIALPDGSVRWVVFNWGDEERTITLPDGVRIAVAARTALQPLSADQGD
jgi:alpha-galactosidase